MILRILHRLPERPCGFMPLMVYEPKLSGRRPLGAMPAKASPIGGEPTAEEVRAQLERILQSSDFLASARNRRFLQHIVEQTLCGRRAKAREIGTVVFGRPSSFDSARDPIVRIEASKLRRDLERYYLTSGRGDPVVIALPKGGYRAAFARVGLPNAVPACSGDSLAFLRAALLGWSDDRADAARAWRDLRREYPDCSQNSVAREVLDAISGGDARVRELLLEGVRRASLACDSANHESGAGFAAAG